MYDPSCMSRKICFRTRRCAAVNAGVWRSREYGRYHGFGELRVQRQLAVWQLYFDLKEPIFASIHVPRLGMRTLFGYARASVSGLRSTIECSVYPAQAMFLLQVLLRIMCLRNDRWQSLGDFQRCGLEGGARTHPGIIQ